MMFTGNPILSRFMAVMLLVVIVTALWAVVVDPLLAARADYREEISRAQRLVAGFQQRRPDIAQIMQARERLRRNSPALDSFITARNSTLAAAQLQSRIKALAEATGASLVSTQIIAPGDGSEGFPRVVVRTQMIATVEALRHIFHALESGRPFLFLDNVSIAVRGPHRSNGDDGLLTVRYDTYGYLWSGGSRS